MLPWPEALFARFRSDPTLYVTPYMPRSHVQCQVIRVREEPPGSLAEAQIVFDVFFPNKPNGPGSPFPYGWDVVSDRTGI